MSTLLPKNTKKNIDFINETMDKKALNNLLSQIYLEFGAAKTAYLANALKNLGLNMLQKQELQFQLLILSVPKEKKASFKKG